jgi:sulfopyruvate decarboxylase subunit beta
MNKAAIIRALLAETSDEPIVFTTGFVSRIACAVEDRASHFYMTGSMGLAALIGVGLCQQTGATTVVVDGDGSILMNPGALLVAGEHDDLPLVHLVLDDGRYESTGGQPSLGAAAAVDWARSSGYAYADHVDSLSAFHTVLRQGMTCRQPALLRCVVTEPDLPAHRISQPLPDLARRFADHVASRSQQVGRAR